MTSHIQSKPAPSIHPKEIAVYNPITVTVEYKYSELVTKLWNQRRQRYLPSRPEDVYSAVDMLSQRLQSYPLLSNELATICKEQLAVSLYTLVQQIVGNKSRDNELAQRVFELFEQLYKQASSGSGFLGRESQNKFGYDKEQIQLFQELIMCTSLRRLDLSSVFRLLRDKIWKLPNESKIKAFSFYVVFDVIRQIWAGTLTNDVAKYRYFAIPYFACSDLFHLVVGKSSEARVLPKYHKLCVKCFRFDAKTSKESLGMPHFQGYNLFKCLLFLVYFLKLGTELSWICTELQHARLLTSAQKIRGISCFAKYQLR